MFGSLTPTVKNLLIINIAIFAIQELLFPEGYFAQLFGLRYINAETFEPYQFVTHLFMHGTLFHLFGNMFALFIFGPMLERAWGSQRFLMFYLVTGLGASLLHSGVSYYEMHQLEQAADRVLEETTPDRVSTFMLEDADFDFRRSTEISAIIDGLYDNPNSNFYINQGRQLVQQVVRREANIPMVGASGAVFGILMAFGLLFPNTELFLLFFPFPIKAKYFVFFYGAYELWAGFSRQPGDNVAHFAHLGGMLFAFILLKLWKDKRDAFY